MSDPNTVIVDTETSGILSKDPTTEICQLSITDVKGKPLFSMLIKTSQPMSAEVIGIHGITNEQIQHQPIFPQVAKLIAFVLEGKHIVAFNAEFDIRLLWHLFKKYDQTLPKISGSSCCMDRYSEWCGEWSEKKQGWKWQRLPNLSGLSAHDAYADCLSTIKVMEKMAGNFNDEELTAEMIDLDF